MPVSSSRLPGFFKLSVAERRDKICELAGLGEEHKAALAKSGELSDEAADRIVENVVGTYSLPIGVATNFIIDGEHYVIPMVLEEPSVVAAAPTRAGNSLESNSSLDDWRGRVARALNRTLLNRLQPRRRTWPSGATRAAGSCPTAPTRS